MRSVNLAVVPSDRHFLNHRTFTDLNKAIAQLPSGGGAICIKNGTYQLTSALSIPAKKLDIFGESKDGVIVRNAAGLNLFEFSSGSALTYSFSNFTIESQNTAGSRSSMFYDSRSGDQKELYIGDLIMSLTGASDSDGDYGVKLEGTYKFSARSLNVTGGMFGIYHTIKSAAGDNLLTAIDDSTFSGQYNAAIQATSTTIYIRKNILSSVKKYGIYIPQTAAYSASAKGGSIIENEITASDVDTLLYLIYVVGDSFNVSDNRLFANMTALISDLRLLATYCSWFPGSIKNIVIAKNRIIVTCNAAIVYGIYMNETINSAIDSNIVQIDNNHVSPTRSVGVALWGSTTGYDNVVANNMINMTNSGATDIGIMLYGVTSTRGKGNQCKNCGTKISDTAGSDNTVNYAGGSLLSDTGPLPGA